MEELTCINFTYRSPHEDIEEAIGVNPDGSTNILYTLSTMKNLLLKNLDVVNKLIEKANKIDNINPVGYSIINISIKDKTVHDELLENGTIIKHNSLNTYSDDESGIEIPFSDEETNQDRLNMITNLLNQANPITTSDNHYDTTSDSDGDDYLIDDPKNVMMILNKYGNFINNGSESDDNSDID